MSRSGRKIKAKKRFIEELEQPTAKRPRSSLHPHSQVTLNTKRFMRIWIRIFPKCGSGPLFVFDADMDPA
jgi:hypothetical protein